jgi:hypothetical protein
VGRGRAGRTDGALCRVGSWRGGDCLAVGPEALMPAVSHRVVPLRWPWPRTPFPTPARRTVHAVLSHTAHRRRSPPAFGVTRQARKGLGEATMPSRPTSPRWFGDRKKTTERPYPRLRWWRLLTTSARRIRMYPVIAAKRRAELPYRKYAAQPRANRLTLPTIASTGSSNRDRSVSSRIRSRACCMALFEGQRARKMTRLPGRRPSLRTSRWPARNCSSNGAATSSCSVR